ncbi:MAG: hypothetical protein Q9167_003144, partial [Letrouitia subvulpina]
MIISLSTLLLGGATLASLAAAQVDPALTGTWTTKSRKVFTGPPTCPRGVIQWQHGKFHKASNGSLILTPFAVDGRQLISDPCTYRNAVYTRYKQQEIFKQYEVISNPYDKATRLNLYGFDGAPMNPMYLAYKPPEMLPTKTLNPTSNSEKGSQPTSKSKVKRSIPGDQDGLVQAALNKKILVQQKDSTMADRLWWLGAGMTLLGS